MIAITRGVSAAIRDCELTHLDREPIDLERARAQHRRYEALLVALGCSLISLPADDALPDCVFVEDTVIVLPEVAIVTNPGAVSRRPEVETVAEVVARYRPLARIQSPGTIDGGDVLVSGRDIFIGRSERTSDDAIEQVRAIAAPFGYRVVPVSLHGCLHLKSAVTAAAEGILLINRQWCDTAPFAGYELLDVDESEPSAANVLRVGEEVIVATAFPRTRARLEARRIRVHTVDADELAKAEGAVTCCSVLL
jgi:dimethylargininase